MLQSPELRPEAAARCAMNDDDHVIHIRYPEVAVLTQSQSRFCKNFDALSLVIRK